MTIKKQQIIFLLTIFNLRDQNITETEGIRKTRICYRQNLNDCIS